MHQVPVNLVGTSSVGRQSPSIYLRASCLCRFAELAIDRFLASLWTAVCTLHGTLDGNETRICSIFNHDQILGCRSHFACPIFQDAKRSSSWSKSGQCVVSAEVLNSVRLIISMLNSHVHQVRLPRVLLILGYLLPGPLRAPLWTKSLSCARSLFAVCQYG